MIQKNSEGITIKSIKYPVKISSKINENYIFIKNDPLLLNAVSTFTQQQKDLISTVDYIFYGNKAQNYYLKLKMKKGELPFILR